MNLLENFPVLVYLYWLLLLLVTAGSLTCAVLAFRTQKRVFMIISAGALAAALFIAAAPVPEFPPAFLMVLGLLSIALAVIGGSPAAILALDLATGKSVAPGIHGGILVKDRDTGMDSPAATAMATHEVLRGGLTIGVLERLATVGAIMAGFPEALAVVVAVKGVGRFGELSAPESRERFIIGSFASLIWACAAAILVRIAGS
jgi:hypothetical protein